MPNAARICSSVIPDVSDPDASEALVAMLRLLDGNADAADDDEDLPGMDDDVGIGVLMESEGCGCSEPVFVLAACCS